MTIRHSDTFLLPAAAAAAVSETGSEIPVTAFVSFWLSHLGKINEVLFRASQAAA